MCCLGELNVVSCFSKANLRDPLVVSNPTVTAAGQWACSLSKPCPAQQQQNNELFCFVCALCLLGVMFLPILWAHEVTAEFAAEGGCFCCSDTLFSSIFKMSNSSPHGCLMLQVSWQNTFELNTQVYRLTLVRSVFFCDQHQPLQVQRTHFNVQMGQLYKKKKHPSNDSIAGQFFDASCELFRPTKSRLLEFHKAKKRP